MKIKQHNIIPLLLGVITVVGFICVTIADVSKNQKEVPCHESR